MNRLCILRSRRMDFQCVRGGRGLAESCEKRKPALGATDQRSILRGSAKVYARPHRQDTMRFLRHARTWNDGELMSACAPLRRGFCVER